MRWIVNRKSRGVNDMNVTVSGFEIFAQSVQENISHLLNNLGFEKEQVDSRLFVFSKKNLTIKVYLPECHGFDVTITLSPIYTRTHYDKSERSLYWLGKFLDIGDFNLTRRTAINQIPELVE